ncbi:MULTISPECIES: RDD family protein [unclassified Colwellia]|jgi:uncharacterized RDD family membrane protein YckC|uniref:RDD family protein n=1 Tax=unclassified Colwellia TaxID=196834 RepID=UPI0015F35EDC|nr:MULTISPECIES: RDD family protein [unclassified Colwellia]MBA6254423.1 RDD family protein [Colwellia sp. MB3u-28]MBA6258500.1 RDD family protein [Colwellia sp. MB3u-41]
MNYDVPATMGDVNKYTGFWSRVGASLIDTIIIIAITYPVLISVYGWEYLEGDDIIAGYTDFILSFVFPMVAVIAYWVYRQATPGKIAISAKIVDAKTGEKPTLQQYITRYVGYILSIIPFGLGFLCVAWDKKKQGWHDKLAGTVVISSKGNCTENVSFESKKA